MAAQRRHLWALRKALYTPAEQLELLQRYPELSDVPDNCQHPILAEWANGEIKCFICGEPNGKA